LTPILLINHTGDDPTIKAFCEDATLINQCKDQGTEVVKIYAQGSLQAQPADVSVVHKVLHEQIRELFCKEVTILCYSKVSFKTFPIHFYLMLFLFLQNKAIDTSSVSMCPVIQALQNRNHPLLSKMKRNIKQLFLIFFKNIESVLETAMRPQNIQAGWSKTGLRPFNQITILSRLPGWDSLPPSVVTAVIK
jgi:hypothetical protein